eukprot:jgi/Botrbrau1/16575/Bobra.0068s0006.1
MPYIKCGEGETEATIYYEVRGPCECQQRDSVTRRERECQHGAVGTPSIVLIMGFAATHGCWGPQLQELLRGEADNQVHAPAMRALLMDNRGVGRSSSPKSVKAYSISLMANDVLTILDVLGWGPVHVIGHSMGGMIAAKLAALAPERVASLTLISATAGGWQAVPRSYKALKYAIQLMKAKTQEERAHVDLKFHFMKRTLRELHPKYGCTRRELLHEEYVEGSKGGGMGQPPDGFRGQLHAIWSNRITEREAEIVRAGDFPVMVLHGRHDLLAACRFGEQLARRFEATFVEMEGAHFLTREKGPEINALLREMISDGPIFQADPYRYLEPGDTHPAARRAAHLPYTAPQDSSGLGASTSYDSDASSTTCLVTSAKYA